MLIISWIELFKTTDHGLICIKYKYTNPCSLFRACVVYWFGFKCID